MSIMNEVYLSAGERDEADVHYYIIQYMFIKLSRDGDS